jgi:hypothetical protein
LANTTNYNWETPDDTDLVKDGAAAIRTLGSSIDTTTKALNPETTLGDIAYRSATSNTNTRLPIGTSGQILSVSGGVPAWINNDQGDITEVAAGTGISVASGTGPVPTVSINTAVTADLTTAQTLTNKTLTSPVLTTPTISTIDAKGDLLVGTADNTIGRLAVRTNTYILTADSAEATGLKWAAPAASTPTFVGCRLKRNSQQVVSNNTETTIQFNAEDFDTDSFHDNSTNNTRVTIPSGKGGKYLFVGTAYGDTGNIDKLGKWYTYLRKNGAGSINTTYIEFGGSASGYETWSIYSILDLVAGDYIEWRVLQSTGVSANLDADYQSLSVTYLGA